jgi:hypothetical protein
MNPDGYVRLDRQFSLVPKSDDDSEHDEAFYAFGLMGAEGWNDIEQKFRCVILAEAGAGKTEEMRQRAMVLSEQGKASFFIRIEDIEADFYKAFEIGESSQFNGWLKSSEEAWFFLDSIDEARLENPRTFEKALRKFAGGIRSGAHRAHIILSSRPFAWRPKEDRRLLDDILLFAEPKAEERDGTDEGSSDSKSALTLYSLRPLDGPRIRQFCENRRANDVNRLLQEIERADLWSLAERPFDLEGILAKWDDDGFLGGRLELLRHNIDKRLSDGHSSDRAQRKPLNIEIARDGARRLAAAVVLTGQAGISVPDSTAMRQGIDAEFVLVDWDPADVRSLLDRGIFNDVIYGAVRFRHRGVRELLAAEWLDDLLKSGSSRYSIESLIFRRQYGENIIAPRLRPLLPWLILFDETIQRRTLGSHPEIAVEGGDPSKLPLFERRKLLGNIVGRIALSEDNRAARDNTAISRIASSDLSEEASRLINVHGANDDAIFFLGRLVWQGEMRDCVANLISIANDSSRGIYARIASVRAAMTCGSQSEKQALMSGLRECKAELPRELLAELVDNLEPSTDSVEQALVLIKLLPPYEEYSTSGLTDALNRFVERLPMNGDRQELSQLTEGLYRFLQEPPFIEARECEVSEESAWLLSPAIRAVERLVEARSSQAFSKTTISIMFMVPVLRMYRDSDIRRTKDKLHALVPAWPELNDAVYWASIKQENNRRLQTSGEPLSHDGPICWPFHFWEFNLEGLSRLLDYIRSRALTESERKVALSTAFRVYTQAERPASVLESLRTAAASSASLQKELELFLNPPVSEAMQRYERQGAEFSLKQEKREQREKRGREARIAELLANPERVRNHPGIPPGKSTNEQVWLLHEIQGSGIKTSRSDGSNWQSLFPDFGEEVALAFRDAAVHFWREYAPTLQSELGVRDNSVPHEVILAMIGLEIEATETEGFPQSLSESEASHALRYITWEINGFPNWFEQVHRVFPTLAENAVLKELFWELENEGPKRLSQSILHDLVYYGIWLHGAIAPKLLEWAERNRGAIKVSLHYVLNILVGGGIDGAKLASIADREIALSADPDVAASWFALLVDCEPSKGIAELKCWLSELDDEKAKHAAQVFVTQLVGGRHATVGRARIGCFQTPEHLKLLYILMHQYIMAEEDINRAGKGVFSPGLRDDAQDARDSLFNLLAGIPGKATYTAVKQLANEHPNHSYRHRMHALALKRAEEDGDLEPWTAKQVSDFHKHQTITPVTHRQLFELTVQRLQDLKSWLERGNDSPWKTWQRVQGESEMRTLIAGWLSDHSRNQYTTAQEPELANNQRMDIWLHNTHVSSPVPIELKLLDKQWSGPKLCERLRNQLAGDYLREESAGCGVFLLVAGRLDQGKRWDIGGQRVVLGELGNALKGYWESIAHDYPGVESIDVVIIDLGLRRHVSQS